MYTGCSEMLNHPGVSKAQQINDVSTASKGEGEQTPGEESLDADQDEL